MRTLTALPVFNELQSVNGVLDQVRLHVEEVLVVDDGSTDGTSELLAQRSDIRLLRHPVNRGYGRALISAFEFAIGNDYDAVVTIDCDGQHEPQRINQLVERLQQHEVQGPVDIVSGSRYLRAFSENSAAPAQRRWVNQQITAELNERLGLNLTDAFCGFKAYRTSSLQRLKLTEPGYAMPLELWVQAACAKLKIVEVAVPLIYLDEKRTFGGELDDAATRLNYYNRVLEDSCLRAASVAVRLDGSQA